MRTLLLTGAAALSLASIPFAVLAQDDASTSANVSVAATPVTLTVEQQSSYDGWPVERQTTYTAWIPVYQTYYWTLTPSQQDAYWLLTDAQRAKIEAMNAQQRTLAWQSIEKQLASAQSADQANAAVAPVSATAVASHTTADGQSQAIITTTTGNASPPPAEALNKTYPLCSKTVHDSCQNRGEGGAPGRSTALGYWPGKPASELKTETDTGG